MDVTALSSTLNGLAVAPSSEAYADLSEEERERIILRELGQVRQVNDVLDGVLEAIDTAEGNLGLVLQATKNADSVLDTWVQILSQAEHTKDLLLDKHWQGSTEDDKLQHARDAARAKKLERERIEREKRERQQELMARKRQETEEKKRLRDEALQRRIYGRKPVSSTARSASSGTATSTAGRTLQNRSQSTSKTVSGGSASMGRRIVSDPVSSKKPSNTTQTNGSVSRIRPPTDRLNRTTSLRK